MHSDNRLRSKFDGRKILVNVLKVKRHPCRIGSKSKDIHVRGSMTEEKGCEVG